jgi:hypothetical protein
MKLLKTILLCTALGSCRPYIPVIPDNLEQEIAEEQRDDFNVHLVLNEYFVGNPFNFKIGIQNKTNDNILLDNMNQTGLEYRLLKEEEVLINQKMPKFTLEVYPTGFFEVDYTLNKLKAKIWGLRFSDEKNTFNVPLDCPIPFSVSRNAESYFFKEAGVYTIEASINYEINEEEFNVQFEKEFEVEN